MCWSPPAPEGWIDLLPGQKWLHNPGCVAVPVSLAGWFNSSVCTGFHFLICLKMKIQSSRIWAKESKSRQNVLPNARRPRCRECEADAVAPAQTRRKVFISLSWKWGFHDSALAIAAHFFFRLFQKKLLACIIPTTSEEMSGKLTETAQ